VKPSFILVTATPTQAMQVAAEMLSPSVLAMGFGVSELQASQHRSRACFSLRLLLILLVDIIDMAQASRAAAAHAGGVASSLGL